MLFVLLLVRALGWPFDWQKQRQSWVEQGGRAAYPHPFQKKTVRKVRWWNMKHPLVYPVLKIHRGVIPGWS